MWLAVCGLVVVVLVAAYIYNRLTIGRCKSTTDLTGKTAIVTGSNAGIGYYTALDFAKRNCRVILACRNVKKAELAAEEIRTVSGNPNVLTMVLDTSRLHSVQEFAKEFLATENRLDILVNNAGIARFQGLSKEGLDQVMATNYFGHFLLTNLLLDCMKKTGSSRVVNVSSLIHAAVWSLDLKTLATPDESNFMKSTYGRSKLCNVLFTVELARRLQGTGVTTYSLHPGGVATKIRYSLPAPLLFLSNVFLYMMKSPDEGAQTSIYCSVEPGIEAHNGKYFSDCQLKEPSLLSKDAALAKKLWEATEHIVGMNEK